MCVTPLSPSRIRVRCSSICSGARPSNRRRPWPKSTGMTWSSISSRTPAASPSCAVPAPWTRTFLVACGLPGSSHCSRDVVDVGDQRPLPEAGGVLASENEDRHAVVMVAAPAACRFEGPSAGDDRPGGHELVDDLAVDAARMTRGLEVVDAVAATERPFVQAFPAVTQSVVGPLVRPGDEPVERHGHVENRCGHGASFIRPWSGPLWDATRNVFVCARVISLTCASVRECPLSDGYLASAARCGGSSSTGSSSAKPERPSPSQRSDRTFHQ
jgi:hypothetical protein